jgi:Intracellular proteinase inhibitor
MTSKALLLLGLLLAIGIVGCGDDSLAGLEVSCEMADQLGEDLAPRLVFENDGSEFQTGEPITFSLSVTNCSDNQIVITYPSAQRYEFLVEPLSDLPREIWRWSNGRTFAEGLSDETFQARETKTYTETWEQREHSGQQVPPASTSSRVMTCTAKVRTLFPAVLPASRLH